MPPNILDAIKKSEDREWLKTCRDHNASKGDIATANAATQRLRDLELRDTLKPRGALNSLKARIEESLRTYEGLLEHKHGRKQAAGYTRRDIKEHGHREALIRTIRRGKKTDGLKLLQEHGRLDCAYEQIALDFVPEMPDDVVELARRTLESL